MQLADNIPQGEINSSDGRRSHDAASMPEVLPPHHLPQVFDAGGILTDQQLRNVLDRPNDASCVPFESRFPPAKQPWLIGMYLYKNPISHSCMTNECFDSCYFHSTIVAYVAWRGTMAEALILTLNVGAMNERHTSVAPARCGACWVI
jgi:hypothetical protein